MPAESKRELLEKKVNEKYQLAMERKHKRALKIKARNECLQSLRTERLQ